MFFFFIFLLQILHLLCLFQLSFNVDSTEDLSCGNRSLQSLKLESKAILPGQVLSYKNGQLPIIQKKYRTMTKQTLAMDCSIPGAYNHISQRTACPWRFVLNIDEHRIPREIYEAQCSTASCLGSTINGCRRQKCEEIKHFTWVKRNTGSDPTVFTNILEPISVGCTCACKRRIQSPVRSDRTIMCSWCKYMSIIDDLK